MVGYGAPETETCEAAAAYDYLAWQLFEVSTISVQIQLFIVQFLPRNQ